MAKDHGNQEMRQARAEGVLDATVMLFPLLVIALFTANTKVEVLGVLLAGIWVAVCCVCAKRIEGMIHRLITSLGEQGEDSDRPR